MLRYGGHPRNEAVKAPRLTNGRSENKRFASVKVQSSKFKVEGAMYRFKQLISFKFCLRNYNSHVG